MGGSEAKNRLCIRNGDYIVRVIIVEFPPLVLATNRRWIGSILMKKTGLCRRINEVGTEGNIWGGVCCRG
jgi:hypothetical protein